MSRTAAIAAADRAYSRMVRILAADPHTGLAECCTCGTRSHWSRLDAGHYITRAAAITRYDPRNTAPQCYRCNRYENGRPEEFARYIDATHGPGTAEELRKLSKRTARFTLEDYAVLTERFRRITKEHQHQ